MPKVENGRNLLQERQELAQLDAFNVSMVDKIIGTSKIVVKLPAGIHSHWNVLTESELELLREVRREYVKRRTKSRKWEAPQAQAELVEPSIPDALVPTVTPEKKPQRRPQSSLQHTA